MIHQPTGPGASNQRTDEILRFFRHLFAGVKNPSGDLYLCIATGKRDLKTGEIPDDEFDNRYYLWPTEQRDAAKRALRRADAGYEVYCCVHLLTEKSRKKKAAATVRTLWADLDGAPLPEGERAPTAVVESSPGHYHPYWRLPRELEPQRAEALAKALAHELGADSCWNLGRVLRVPGTFNHKEADPRVVGVKTLDPAREVDPAALPGFATKEEPTRPGEARENGQSPSASGARSESSAEAGDPPVRLRGDALARWHGETYVTKEDGSAVDRSRTLFAIARDLHRANATEPVIAQALQERDRTFASEAIGLFGKGVKYGDRPHLYLETARNAILDRGGTPHSGATPPPRKNTEDQSMPPAAEEEHEIHEAAYNRTDLGNAERLVARYGENLRYCHPWRKWLVWDGKRWAEDTTGVAARLGAKTVRSIYEEARDETDPDVSKALAKHAIASESRTRIESMIALAQSQPKIPVTPEDLDADPWLLCLENGTLDLRSGNLREHRREDYITKLAPVSYDKDAQAPAFHAFLERILPDPSLRAFVQRAVGYAASGVVSEEVLVIFHGTGENGKTTLVNVLLQALGDYGIQAARDLLLAKRGTHPTELTDLFGVRFVACVETDDKRRLAEALVKQLTGRERIRARGMRQDFWEFDPTHTIILSTNHKPEIQGTDHAIWRRIKLVPFKVRIPEKEKDTKLPEKLRKELPGILAWIVRGALEYQRIGLGEPEPVTQATAGYRKEMDVLGAFIEDCCVLHPDAQAPATPLYKTYQEWCEDVGEGKEKQTAFGLRLSERGFQSISFSSGPHRGRKGWRGIGLRTDELGGPPDGPPSGGSGPEPAGQDGTLGGFDPDFDPEPSTLG